MGLELSTNGAVSTGHPQVARPPLVLNGIRDMAPEAPFARYGLVLAVQEILSDARSDPLAKATTLLKSGGACRFLRRFPRLQKTEVSKCS
ncbi:rCG43916 [Rattus norvegicus]|uniref:RCG43916 n=1 Tax=Rattus norvegicus TaxID=10116 RepID=A6J6U8_RAT|nr:rCG43916 [Rattus norvegicus]